MKDKSYLNQVVETIKTEVVEPTDQPTNNTSTSLSENQSRLTTPPPGIPAASDGSNESKKAQVESTGFYLIVNTTIWYRLKIFFSQNVIALVSANKGQADVAPKIIQQHWPLAVPCRKEVRQSDHACRVRAVGIVLVVNNRQQRPYRRLPCHEKGIEGTAGNWQWLARLTRKTVSRCCVTGAIHRIVGDAVREVVEVCA